MVYQFYEKVERRSQIQGYKNEENTENMIECKRFGVQIIECLTHAYLTWEDHNFIAKKDQYMEEKKKIKIWVLEQHQHSEATSASGPLSNHGSIKSFEFLWAHLVNYGFHRVVDLLIHSALESLAQPLPIGSTNPKGL